MEDILFIVHPYTYRIDNDGDAAITDQSSEMDFKIDLLTKQFLKIKIGL